MISIAMATYNGDRYLHEQLRSLREQSRLPDELVIIDDASTDSTLAIARRFAASAPFPVVIEVNDANLGSTPTFERAIRLCRGDVIALCDQDDVWLPTKLARIEQAMGSGCGFAFSDAECVSEDGTSRGRLWPAVGFAKREQRRFCEGSAFASLLRRNFVTGATMAFRSSFRDRMLPIPTGWVHDAWIALVLAALAPCVPIDESLIRYRQHGGQQIGAARRTLADEYRAAAKVTAETFAALRDQHEQARERLMSIGAKPEMIDALAQKVRHLDARSRMRTTWRLPRVARELCSGRYFRYSRGWASAAQDLFLS